MSFACDFSYGQAQQKVVFCDGHFDFRKFVTTSKAGYIFAVDESFGNFVYSPSDTCLVGTGQPCHLAKAIAILKIHRHQQLVLAGEQVYPAAQQVDSVAILVFDFRCHW